jgi:ABC-type proline/glycine betaine transport system permease subunit
MKKTIPIIALLLLILAVISVGVVEQHRELSRQRTARAAIQEEQIKRQEGGSETAGNGETICRLHASSLEAARQC